MKPLNIPVKVVGQEEDGLEYFSMPKGMDVYAAPHLPEPEEMVDLAEAKAVLAEMRAALASCGQLKTIGLGYLPAADRALLGQVLGEGEVSIRIDADFPVKIQESILTGVWQIRGFDQAGTMILDEIEVGAFPERVISSALESATGIDFPESLPKGGMNALPVLAELRSKAESYRAGDAAHVVNLTLLPMTPADMGCIEAALGIGAVTILSRGYGNCRISSTQLANVWWVQYYNSQDVMILNTLEVVDLPDVVRAASQDIEDSCERLEEILQWVGA